jgi:pimeloyl-ACP methyl ester carboxylesterase
LKIQLAWGLKIMMLDVAGKAMHVVDMNPGAREAVILVHGLFTNFSVYMFGVAGELSRSFRVVIYDLRGHGLSEGRGQGYSLGDYCGDLLSLMGALGIGQAYLAGHSLGASIALYAASTYPTVFRSVALIECTMLADRLLPGLIRKVGAGKPNAALRAHRYVIGQKPVAADTSEIEARIERLCEGNALIDGLSSGKKFMREADLGKLQMPALLLYGWYSPFLLTGLRLRARLPHSRLAIGSGNHSLPVQSGRWVGAQLAGFFSL